VSIATFRIFCYTPADLLFNSEVRRAPVASQIFARLARGVLLNNGKYIPPYAAQNPALRYVAWHRLKRLKELIRAVTVSMSIVFNTCPSLNPLVSLGMQLFNFQLELSDSFFGRAASYRLRRILIF
jgi:hypothetical protein